MCLILIFLNFFLFLFSQYFILLLNLLLLNFFLLLNLIILKELALSHSNLINLFINISQSLQQLFTLNLLMLFKLFMFLFLPFLFLHCHFFKNQFTLLNILNFTSLAFNLRKYKVFLIRIFPPNLINLFYLP